MSRTAAVLVVLALAISPDAAILCRALCAPTADVTTACDHNGAGPAQIAGAGDCCDDMVAVAASSQDPAMRPGTSFPDGSVAMPVRGYAPGRPVTASQQRYEPGRTRSLEHRPLSTILRI